MDISVASNRDEENGDDGLQAASRVTFSIEESSQNSIADEEENECNMDIEDKDNKDEIKEYENLDPEVGMEFETEQSAYDFYEEYARKVGFAIRKEWRNINRSGIVTRRKFCCTREGTKKWDRRRLNVRFPRDSTKVDCKAHIMIAVQPNGKYQIVKFEASHNHPCAPDKAHMFKPRKKTIVSQRPNKKIKVDQAFKLNAVNGVRILPKPTFDFMIPQDGGQESVVFLPTEYTFYLPSKRTRLMEKGDAGGVLQYLQKMSVEDPGSVYAIQLDVEEQITNIFWADSRMVMDYHAFGDVVCFDTTFRKNNYNRPFALFVGVNHHKQIVVFGAAFIYDDTVESFKWVFKAFLDTMSGKQPQTFLADHDCIVANAVASIMPKTSYRICAWHLYQNVEKQLSLIFKSSKSYHEDFGKCVYDCDEEPDFLDAWESMLEKYNLRENMLLQQLFNEREKWALVYCRDTYCADIQGTLRREFMSSTLARYLHRSYDILRFFPHFKSVMFDRRKTESEAEFKMTQSIPTLILEAPMLIAARNLYTPENFKLFQEEYVKGLSCFPKIVGETGTLIIFKVSCVKNKREYDATFDSVKHKVTCSCKKFEFTGILCAHALRVIDNRGLPEVPSRYILKRWSKNAKVEAQSSTYGTATSQDKILSHHSKELMRRCMKLDTIASENDAAFSVALKGIDFICTKVEEFLNLSPHSAKSVLAGNVSHLAESVNIPATSQTSNESFDVQPSSTA